MHDQAPDLWQQLELASELEFDLQDTVDLGRLWLIGFNTGKTQLVSFDRTKNLLEEKSYFKMLGLTFSSKFDLGLYIISIAKTASMNFGGLICSMKFLSPEIVLYLYKSTI